MTVTLLPLSLYRYSQLIYLTLIGKHRNLPYLHRDTILVRFFHSFLSSAPHLVIHLYATIVAFSSSSDLSPAVLSALAISTVSVLYSTLSFATNDRVSGKNRRVVLPAHLTQMLWHVCMVLSRVLALTLFAYVFEYYVVAVVGGHWLVMLFLLLLERTTFCADIQRQGNGELKFTRRLCLEIPFDILAAFVYVFVYFNPKRGRTRVWASIYHLVTLAENVTMAVLFYLTVPSSSGLQFLRLPGIILIIGLYVVGMTFMFCYYLIYHPKRTDNWHWIGFPRNCRCCCCKDESENQEMIGTKYQHRNSRVIISEPTLVSHNGFVPKNMLPVGPNAVPVVNYSEAPSSYSQVVSMPSGRVRARDRSMAEPHARRTNGSVGMQAGHVRPIQELESSLSFQSPNSSRTNTARTVGESNPTFSDFMQSDTDFSSNAMEMNDTVIDTPLFGSTPEGVVSMSDARLMHITRIISQDNESQKTCTNDTGIDMDSDLQLSPGGDMETGDGAVGGVSLSGEVHREDAGEPRERKLPVFVDVPVKQHNYKSGGLERHYFPSQEENTGNQSSQDAALHSRESVTPTLPTPPCSPSSSPGSTRRHPSEDSEDVFHQDSSYRHAAKRENSPLYSGSQPSPDRPRKAPRSPIGARAHQVTMDDGELSGSQRSTHTPTLPSIRAVTPRSPKGARRLLIQQPSPIPAVLTTQMSQPRRQAPPPPIPPKTRNEGVNMLSENLPPIFTSNDSGATVTTDHAQMPPHPPPTQATPKDKPSDGLTRGLLSLVPMSAAERRAHSSSPYPNSRKQVDPQSGHAHSRSVSYHPNAPVSPKRIPSGVSNYKRVGVLESEAARRGSTRSVQHYPVQQRPKSDGWRADRSTAVQMLTPQGRVVYHQAPLNSHGSSPERTAYNSTSGDQRFARTDDAHRKQGYGRPNPSHPKPGTRPYSTHVPKSAFNRVSPERSRAHHVDEGAGAWHSQGSHLTESYPASRPTRTSEANIYPPRSPRRYPKAPQGAMHSAPKMIQSSLPKNIVNVPPPLPPPRKDNSIDEPMSELNSSSRTHSLGAASLPTSRRSGEYDRLPTDTLMVGVEGAGPSGVNRANRGSFISPTTLHPPTSSAHESVV